MLWHLLRLHVEVWWWLEHTRLARPLAAYARRKWAERLIIGATGRTIYGQPWPPEAP